MYIPEFWLGLATALGGEFLMLIAILVVSYIKDQKKKRK